MDIPVVRIPITKGTEVYHLAGENKLITDPVTGEVVTSYKKGRFSDWYDRTCFIVVDEANLQPEVWEFLRPAADGAKQIMLDDAQGLTINRGQRTFFGMTQNPAWDPVYVGTEPVSAADLQRVVPFWIGYPEKEIEAEIITAHCADDGYEIKARTLDHILQISETIRDMSDIIPVPWGVRSNIKVAKLSKYMDLPNAYRRAVLDGQEPMVVDQINDTINTVVAS
jgi:MoxR-like ATPase